MNEANEKSEISCGNCGEYFETDDDGAVIQPCPHCDSNEMVKGVKDKE